MRSKKLCNIITAGIIGACAFGIGVYALNGDFKAKADALNSVTNAVELTIDETTTGYVSFEKALTAASGAEYAEIKLLMDTQGVQGHVLTNLTIDLNGFTLENTALSTKKVSGGVSVTYASLIIVDYSNAKTGKVTGIPGFGWTFYKGNNAIYGGQFDKNVGFFIDGEGTTLEIAGGSFERLSAKSENQGALTLYDFETEELRLRASTGGTVVCQGGSFQKWESNEGMLSDWLADGYKIFDPNKLEVNAETQSIVAPDGEYYTIIEHSECYYDEYAHTETEHWQGCTCGATANGATPEKEEHTWENGYCNVCYFSHKHEKLDEKGYCSVCEGQMAIKVVDGENATFYNDLSDAVFKMPENATLTLIKDVYTSGKSLYITKPITLDLNGKNIELVSSENIYVEAPVTIIDRVGTGFVAPELILGNTAVLKGGTYHYISVHVEGKKYSDFLGAGYHYYLEGATLGEDQPLTDEQIAEAWQNYQNVKVVLDCAHTGGSATCQAKAVCEICGNEYGGLSGHTPDGNWRQDETHHWQDCVLAGNDENHEKLNFGAHQDKDKNGKCDVCNKVTSKETKNGCGSVMGGGTALALLSAAAGAFAFRKKKEN